MDCRLPRSKGVPQINATADVAVKRGEDCIRTGEIGAPRIMATKRGQAGQGSKGACGGTRRRDGSGGGTGNRGTKRQPAPRKR